MVLLCCVLLAFALVFVLFLSLLPLWCRVFWLLVLCCCWCLGFAVCWVFGVWLCVWCCWCVLLRVARVLSGCCSSVCVGSGVLCLVRFLVVGCFVLVLGVASGCLCVLCLLFVFFCWFCFVLGCPLFCGPPGVGVAPVVFRVWLLFVFWLVVVVVLLCPLFLIWCCSAPGGVVVAPLFWLLVCFPSWLVHVAPGSCVALLV